MCNNLKGANFIPILQTRKMVQGNKVTGLKTGSLEVMEPGIQDQVSEFQILGN